MNIESILLNSKNWNDLKNRLEKLSTKEKGDAFELLTKLFLLIDPKYSTKLEKVWLFNEIPDKIRKFLKLPETDQGIDLIAETKSGEYWAIQCKYRTDEKKQTTWREVSTFSGLTYSVCKNISFGLICTTTERLTKVLGEQDKIGFCTSEVWDHLGEDFFEQVHRLLKKEKVKIEAYKPRPHQERAIKNAQEYFVKKKKKRGKLIMPCGSGKSLAAFWITEKLDAKTILVAVPSLALIRQTLEVWLREYAAKNINVNWVCVCSDKSVGKFERDDVLVNIQDLGIPCITEIGEIKDWFKNTSKNEVRVVFTTYQSGKVIAQASRESKIKYDISIYDEAHKTVGQKDKLFTHLLEEKNISVDRRIFMTATERRYAGNSDDIVSMDNEAIYGDTFEQLSFKEAMEMQPPILSDYKIITIFVDTDEIQEMIEKNAYVKTKDGDDEIEAEMLASVIALRKAMQKYPIKHTVSFHSSIKRAKLFQENQEEIEKRIKKYEPIDVFHVTGKTPTSVRHRIIKDFASSKKSLITNARCLTEGVDVPNIDCVLFADPKKSTIDIVQAVGRALRPSKGKEYGYIIIPVLIDSTKPEDELEKSAFGYILTILRALASNDDRIIEYFRAISQGRKTSYGNLVNVDIDEKYAQEINIKEFEESIKIQIWDKLAKLSWRPFEEAREFVIRLNLKNQKEWGQYRVGGIKYLGNKPSDIPADPQHVYKNKGWTSWGDWLGTGSIWAGLKVWRSFNEAREYVRNLGLKSKTDWVDYINGSFSKKPKLPFDIPMNPRGVYKDSGWLGWGDWLGTGSVAPFLRQYQSFEEARKFVRKLGLKNQNEWNQYRAGHIDRLGIKPLDIPAGPQGVYKDKGWISWGDWLGTGRTANQFKNYRSFVDARKFARGLKLKSSVEWRTYCDGELLKKIILPSDIPKNPWSSYKDKGWKGMGDWLGIRNLKDCCSFEEARKFARKLKLNNRQEWHQYCHSLIPRKPKLPYNIPMEPGYKYKDKGWVSWGDWLGTGRIADQLKEFRSFKEARKFAKKLKLNSAQEWYQYCRGLMSGKSKLPIDIPKSPPDYYKNKGWVSWGDWLGTGNIWGSKKSKK